MSAINRRRNRLLLRMYSQVVRHNLTQGLMDVLLKGYISLQPGDIFHQDKNVTVVVDRIDGDNMELTATVTQKVDKVYLSFKVDDESEGT